MLGPWSQTFRARRRPAFRPRAPSRRDLFTLQVTSNGYARQPVTVAQNLADPYTFGLVRGNSFIVSSTWTSSNVGTYKQTWYVGGVAATPQLSFTVEP